MSQMFATNTPNPLTSQSICQLRNGQKSKYKHVYFYAVSLPLLLWMVLQTTPTNSALRILSNKWSESATLGSVLHCALLISLQDQVYFPYLPADTLLQLTLHGFDEAHCLCHSPSQGAVETHGGHHTSKTPTLPQPGQIQLENSCRIMGAMGSCITVLSNPAFFLFPYAAQPEITSGEPPCAHLPGTISRGSCILA